MVDNLNPTTQFHPYQPQTDTPATEQAVTSNRDRLMKNVERARSFARNNSGLVLGGLAALAIGAGLMRGRSR